MKLEPNTKPALLIVEDHDALRTAMLEWFAELFPCVECHEASSGEEAINTAKNLQPVVILMDIGLPGIDGIEAMKIIKNNGPDTKFVVLTIFEGDAYKRDAIEAGATAFVGKRDMYTELPLVLESILDCNDASAQR